MSSDKKRIIKDYSKLPTELKEQIKLVYPEGYSQHLIKFKNAQGETVSALPFEDFDTIYMVRMTTERADEIIAHDHDFDDEGNLKDDIREEYEDEHSDVDYLTENDNYEEEEE